jgi:hypothetical protein
MPTCDVAERHHIDVAAPAEVTFTTAREQDLMAVPVSGAIFKLREVVLGSDLQHAQQPHGLIALARSIGWGVLAEAPGREVVMVWTLRADPKGIDASIFRTETRAVATGHIARKKFRRYWSLVSPGIILIRRAALGPLKTEAERRARLTPAGHRR